MEASLFQLITFEVLEKTNHKMYLIALINPKYIKHIHYQDDYTVIEYDKSQTTVSINTTESIDSLFNRFNSAAQELPFEYIVTIKKTDKDKGITKVVGLPFFLECDSYYSDADLNNVINLEPDGPIEIASGLIEVRRIK